MNILISECSIDLVPNEWVKYVKISDYMTKFNRKPLRDASEHQHLLKHIDREMRLDRPDILHLGLLTTLGYTKIIPNLKIFFMIKDETYEIDPNTRLPRSQKRFYGLLESLLQGTYKGDLIKKSKIDFVNSNIPKVLFSSTGIPHNQVNISDYDSFIFGGFSAGEFTKHYRNSMKVSLTESKLELWTSLSLFLSKYFY